MKYDNLQTCTHNLLQINTFSFWPNKGQEPKWINELQWGRKGQEPLYGSKGQIHLIIILSLTVKVNESSLKFHCTPNALTMG